MQWQRSLRVFSSKTSRLTKGRERRSQSRRAGCTRLARKSPLAAAGGNFRAAEPPRRRLPKNFEILTCSSGWNLWRPESLRRRYWPDHVDLEVTNPNVDGLGLRDVPFALESGIVFSRLYRNGRINVPADDSAIHLGDVIRLVGSKTKLLEFERVIGRKSASI
jgi:hypothetical protein